jgi:DNA repair exonuclease SbcCD nuclease subunit
MKFLFFADLQAHNYKQFSTILSSGLNSRLNDCLNVLKQVRKTVKEREITHVFFLGDLFESRTKVDGDVATLVYEELLGMSRECKLYLLVGNHDQHTKMGYTHWMKLFQGTTAVIIDMPMEIILDTGYMIYAVPFIPDGEEAKKAINNIEEQKAPEFLLFHQGLKEAATGPYDSHVKAELSIKDMPTDKVKYCIGGHYHKGQELLDGKIRYVGSPLQLTFGERNEEKGFTIYDVEKDKFEFIFSDAPLFHYFESVSLFNDAKSSIDHNRDFIRVRCNVKEAEDLKKKYPRIQPELIPKPSSKPRIKKEVTYTDEALVAEYILLQKTDLDKRRLAAEGLKILNESK